MKITKQTIIFFALATLAGCGGNDGIGFLSLKIENARGPEGITPPKMFSEMSALKGQTVPSEPLEVTEFKVTVSGDGIQEPITKTAEADAKQIEILGIPAGSDRTILIEAFNGNGEVIRRRELTGISISPDKTISKRAPLNTVPIILNLQDDGIVLAKNFHIEGFGEPGTALKIETETKSESVNLSESVGNGMVVSPSLSTGIFDFTPPAALIGKQTITITDEGTGESSSKTVTVINAVNRPGFMISAGGQTGPFATVGTGFGEQKGGNLPLVQRSIAGYGNTTEVAEETQ